MTTREYKLRDYPFSHEMSVAEVLKNIEPLSCEFVEYGILAFKRLNATESQQIQILSALGDFLKWIPNSKVISSEIGEKLREWLRYKENHSVSIDLAKRFKANPADDRILINWHLEHIENSVSQVGAAWNMIKNTVDHRYECGLFGGSTGFVDCRAIFNSISEEDKYFLINSVIVCVENEGYSMGWECHPNPAARKHFFSDSYVARICPLGHRQSVVSVEGRPPGHGDQERMDEIAKFFINEVWGNTERQTWWEWEEGDMLIPDLDVMAHAVVGGFDESQREFVGYWAFGNDYEKRMNSPLLT